MTIKYTKEQRYGLAITRQNMANWMIRLGEEYLGTMYDYLHKLDSSNVSTIYDIEPDKNNKRKDIDFIAQRTRFYHAIIDSRSLKSGQSYDKLKKVFVIFICPYDPFGDDRMIYTIWNHCVENPELPYSLASGIRKHLVSTAYLLLTP